MPTGSRSFWTGAAPRCHACGTSGRHADAAGLSALLHTSADWADFDEIAQSWFEDDEHVARVVADIGGHQGAQSVDRVLEEILAPRREKWAAYFQGRHCGCARHPKALFGADS